MLWNKLPVALKDIKHFPGSSNALKNILLISRLIFIMFSDWKPTYFDCLKIYLIVKRACKVG